MSAAIVTGAASGIGLATVQSLRDEGRPVIAVDRDAARLDEIPDADDVLRLAVDIADEAQVAAMVDAARSRFGAVTAVANVAGITSLDDQRVEDLDTAVFDRILGVNLRGTFLVCKHALPALRAAGGGAVVIVGSIASLRGAGGTAYVASKHALHGLTRAIAQQYAADGIRCNLVAPGATETPMLELARRKQTSTLAPTADGAVASPSEVASLIAYLLSDAARFISASTYAIDGGVTQY
jgi:3-oxoacyl-[acyl-carrier protein] reductase